MHPQLDYASTVWSPHTATDINKLESVQHRAARWVTCDYRYTSSVKVMLRDLNRRYLDQRRIDSQLVLMHKVTYDLVATPASDYNTKQLWHNHPLAFRQIPFRRHYYKYTFSTRTIIHCNVLPALHLGIVQYGCRSEGTLIPFKHQYSVVFTFVVVFLSFNYTNTLSHSTNSFTYYALLLFRLTPFRSWYTGTPSEVLFGG